MHVVRKEYSSTQLAAILFGNFYRMIIDKFLYLENLCTTGWGQSNGFKGMPCVNL